MKTDSSQETKGMNIPQNERQASKSNPHQFQEGDWALINNNGNKSIGKVEKLYEENNVDKIQFKDKQGTERIIAANNANLQPMFLISKEGKKVYTPFTHKEIIDLVNEKKLFGLQYNDLKQNGNAHNNLRLGHKTKVFDHLQLTSKKEIEGKPVMEQYEVPGRLQLYRDKNNNIKIDLEIGQRKEIDFDQSVYGRKFNEKEKKQLSETGELGLVNGFVNKSTGEIYKLWVSVDKPLNKIVTKPENAIYIDKFYGQELNQKQKKSLMAGKGAEVDFKKSNGQEKKYYIEASAASLRKEGIKNISDKRAAKIGLIPEQEKKEEKKIRLKFQNN